MWYPFIASMNTVEHTQDALKDLDEALYQAKLNYQSGDIDVQRIELAMAILKGNKDELLNKEE